MDGYVPFGVLWDAWRTLQSVQAAQRLSAIRAGVLSHPGSDTTAWQREVDAEVRIAYPAE